MNKLVVLFCFLVLLGCQKNNPSNNPHDKTISVSPKVDSWYWTRLAFEPKISDQQPVYRNRQPAHHFGVLFELDGAVVLETTTIDTVAHIRFEHNIMGIHMMRCGIIPYNEQGETWVDSLGEEIVVWSDSTVVWIQYLQNW